MGTGPGGGTPDPSQQAEVGTLDGVGHGTALGGRYRLEERLQSSPSASYWRAVDQTLERPVGVRVVAGATAEETLDAARRAAMVEDPRLLRVLDVGTEAVGADSGAHLTYVVSEFIDAHSLAALLREEGPLESDDVRALVGEAAQGLERARRAGLHHRRLTPHAILRTGDGATKVAGLAVDAAAAGLDDVDDVTAARQDAVALVAVVYAGLTGRWPVARAASDTRSLVDAGEGLEAAPVVGGQPAPPADLVAGVPNDLDTLCAVTLGPHDDGPRTPGEVAEQLAPWGLPRAGAPRPAARPATTDAAVTATQPLVLPAAAAGRPVPVAPRTAPAQRPPSRFPVRVAAAGAAGGTAAAGAGSAAPPVPRPTPPSPPVGDDERGADRDDDTRNHGGDYGRDDGRDDERLSFSEAIGTGEYAVPPRGGGAAQKVVLAAVAVAVVIGLVLAIQSLAGIGGDGREPAADGGTAAPTATEPATSAPPTSTPPTAPAGTAPAISGITTLDPQGGDGENDDEVSDAIDPNPESWWPSSTYKSADFGGLKDGVGVVVHLAAPSTVSSVTLTFRGDSSGGSFELRTAPGAGLGGSTVVATGSVTGSTVQVALDPPAETQYLIVWFTQLPTVDGEFRIELADVKVQ